MALTLEDFATDGELLAGDSPGAFDGGLFGAEADAGAYARMWWRLYASREMTRRRSAKFGQTLLKQSSRTAERSTVKARRTDL